jgi:RES domain-containing protein
LKVHRICARRYRALDGEGARLHGGRWNHPGTSVVYASATLSLAALEILTQVDADLLPSDLVSIEIGVPDDLEIEEVRKQDLPPGWRRYPAPERLQEIGTAWARSLRAAVLSVPSAIIPEERNYLINPGHPGFSRIAASRPAPFRLEARLLRGRR